MYIDDEFHSERIFCITSPGRASDADPGLKDAGRGGAGRTSLADAVWRK